MFQPIEKCLQEDGMLEVCPMVPNSWEYFRADNVYVGCRRITVLWDKTGRRYGLGTGYKVFVDGVKMVSAPEIKYVRINLSDI